MPFSIMLCRVRKSLMMRFPKCRGVAFQYLPIISRHQIHLHLQKWWAPVITPKKVVYFLDSSCHEGRDICESDAMGQWFRKKISLQRLCLPWAPITHPWECYLYQSMNGWFFLGNVGEYIMTMDAMGLGEWWRGQKTQKPHRVVGIRPFVPYLW